jgi:hypothetical protein
MTFYGTLGVFKLTFTKIHIFDIFAFMVVGGHGRVLADISQNCENRRKSSKISKNREKKKSKSHFFDLFPCELGVLTEFFGFRATQRPYIAKKQTWVVFFKKKVKKLQTPI